MQSRQEKSMKIIYIYYVFNLDTNLLLYKRLCILKLKNRFDINAIYFYKDHKKMLKTNHYENIYVLT